MHFQAPKLRAPLLAAITARDVEETRRLLSNGADITTTEICATLTCPLQLAVSKRDATIVKVLLDAGADPDRYINPWGQRYPLSADILADAVRNDDEDIVRYLLDAGVYVSRLRHGWIHEPLEIAVRMNPHLFIILVQYGADVNSVDTRGTTILIDVLREREYPNRYSVVEKLVELDADVNLPNCHTGITPLQSAILGGGPHGVMELLLMKGADPNSRDHKGRNALHWAADLNDLWALGRLFQENVDLESKMNHRRTQLSVFESLCRRCYEFFADYNDNDTYNWKRLLFCLRAMGILVKAGAKLSSDRDIELFEDLQWFREQADAIYKEPLPRGMEETHLTEIHKILETLLWKCSNVDTLRQLCRLKMRTILKFNFKERLQMLCLPRVLYDYILMKDLLPSSP